MDKLGLNGKTFELTKDHIREGLRKDGSECPLALTLRDFLFCDMNIDEPEINVDFKTVHVEYTAMNEDGDDCDCYFLLDDAITNFIHDFDHEVITYREFQGRTVRIELLEDQSYKLSFVVG